MIHQGKTNYKNSIVNFAASLRKYYNLPTTYPTHALVDFILSRKYKHVALILLDGMGLSVIDDNLGNGSILKTHQIISLNSVYPPTTVAATTSLLDGRAPIESGWLGWSLYLDNESPSIDLFRNKVHSTQEDFTGYQVKDKIPVDTFYNNIKRAKAYSIYPAFAENGCQTFNEAILRLKENLNKDEVNFTYLYWDNPDTIMHEYGPASQVARVTLIDIEEQIQKLSEELPEDTVIFITADHGMVNVEPIDLSLYSGITECFSKQIGGEGRFTQFYIKDEYKDTFKDMFNEAFGDDFKLYTKEEFIKSQLGGLYEPNPICEYALGDFCSVGIKNKFFIEEIKEDTYVFKGHHGGLTKEEMQVPVILLRRRKES